MVIEIQYVLWLNSVFVNLSSKLKKKKAKLSVKVVEGPYIWGGGG
jgi:hypothetical protein